MKALWTRFSGRIDAMSLRERIAIFVAAVAVLLFAMNSLVLEPLYGRNKALASQIRQQAMQVDANNMEIAARIAAAQANPDQPMQNQLAELNKQAAAMTESLRAMQKGLVAPEKISGLLQQLVRSNGKLKLMSLRTLPPAGLGADEKRELLYRHGVELVLQGGYLDMLDYMEALEAAPSQVFWGKAELDAHNYPTATLTLTLYTLSLDDKWMTL